MANNTPTITIVPSKQAHSPSQVVLLNSPEWKQIQRLLAMAEPTAERLAQVAPVMARLMRRRERLLSETDRLPEEITATLHLILAHRTRQKPSRRHK